MFEFCTIRFASNRLFLQSVNANSYMDMFDSLIVDLLWSLIVV